MMDRARALRGAAAALLVSAWLGGGAMAQGAPPAHPAAAPSRSVTIGGAVEHPRSLARADLEAMPATTAQVYYATGRGPVTARFTGVLLWSLLSDAGIRTDAAVRNDRLRRSVVVSAADGYSVTLSLGELDPAFGAAQALLAIDQDGAPLGDSGFARLILPGDKDAGRNVMRVTAIEVR